MQTRDFLRIAVALLLTVVPITSRAVVEQQLRTAAAKQVNIDRGTEKKGKIVETRTKVMGSKGRLADKYIYFPVDSMEEVTVSAKLPAFDRGYRLAGNIYAAGFTSADSLVGDAIDARGETAALSDSVLKRNLNLLINRDTTCLVSYYIVGKTIAGRPLYSLTDKSDLRFLANAANNYKTHRPADLEP